MNVVGQKDLAEKILEDYNDVFADIVNGFLFKGKQVILPNDLRNSSVHSQYKADERKLHEQERDVLKTWTSGKVDIAICGIENQTKPDKYMPMRILGYDGASYRSQLLKKNPNPVPVVTLVLYFGTEKRWSANTELKELFDIPEEMDKYVNNYKINVFEVAWLTDEELDRFKSDFKIVANFLINKRKDKNYIPNDTTEIQHFDEVLKLLSVMTDDKSYEEILKIPQEQRKDVNTMCSVAQNLLSIGKAEGIAEGKAAGIAEGIAEGKAEGIAESLYSLVSDKVITPSVAAERLEISVLELKANMQKKGFTYPTE